MVPACLSVRRVCGPGGVSKQSRTETSRFSTHTAMSFARKTENNLGMLFKKEPISKDDSLERPHISPTIPQYPSLKYDRLRGCVCTGIATWSERPHQSTSDSSALKRDFLRFVRGNDTWQQPPAPSSLAIPAVSIIPSKPNDHKNCLTN